MRKARAINESILFVIIALLIQLMVRFLAGIYYSLRLEDLVANTASEGDLTFFLDQNNLVITLIAWMITMIIFSIMLAFSKQNILHLSQLNKPISLLKIVVCFISGIGINLTINNLLSFINISDLVPNYGKVIESIVDHHIVITLICAGLLVPIGEEILYRGIILGKLRNGFSDFTAVIMQAVFFGLVHLNIVQSTYAFIFGIVFGYVVIWTRSLYSSILMHIAINSLSIILFHGNGLDLDYNQMITLTVIGLLLTVIGLRVLYLDRNRSNENVINFMQ